MGLARRQTISSVTFIPQNVEVLVLHLTSGDGDYAKLSEQEFVVHQFLPLNAIEVLLALWDLDPCVSEERGSAWRDAESVLGRHVLDVELGRRSRYL